MHKCTDRNLAIIKRSKTHEYYFSAKAADPHLNLLKHVVRLQHHKSKSNQFRQEHRMDAQVKKRKKMQHISCSRVICSSQIRGVKESESDHAEPTASNDLK